MSTLKVEVVKINEITAHPNAERLEIAKIDGYESVIPKGSYKPGDLAVYFPVDSVLPPEVEEKLFGANSKVKLNNGRIRAIRLRGVVSQGMLASATSLGLTHAIRPGEDLTAVFGVTKYEPPESHVPANMQGKVVKKTHPEFSRYTDIENIRKFNTEFSVGDPVYISEKLHGTSARFMKVRGNRPGLLGKLLGLIGVKTDVLLVGSRNQEVDPNDESVYSRIARGYKLADKLKVGESLYGEIVGPGIQKGYHYGLKPGEVAFFAYDVKLNGRWRDYEEFKQLCDERQIPRVPELFVGPYSEEKMQMLREGDSTIGGQKVREGVVVKPVAEGRCRNGDRKVLKAISDEYLLKDNTDFH